MEEFVDSSISDAVVKDSTQLLHFRSRHFGIDISPAALTKLKSHLNNQTKEILRVSASVAFMREENEISEDSIKQAIKILKQGVLQHLPGVGWNDED